MRFWKEFRDPALKCERVGHKEGKRSRSGMVRSDSWSYVADRVEQECDWCVRCGLHLSDWRDIRRSGVSSWSAPSDIMRKFEETGAYWH